MTSSTTPSSERWCEQPAPWSRAGGAELNPDGNQVWLPRSLQRRSAGCGREDALARGDRLVNRFEVLVSDDGDTRVERYGGD